MSEKQMPSCMRRKERRKPRNKKFGNLLLEENPNNIMKKITTMHDLIRAFANAMNLISPELENHHERVAYLAYTLADTMGLSSKQKRIAAYGALLHDIGSVMAEGQLSLLDLEMKPRYLAKSGSVLLKKSPLTSSLSDIIGDSQTPWESLKKSMFTIGKSFLIPQIIHLADAVSLLFKEGEPVLNQLPFIRECIYQVGEKKFHPEVLKAFDELCGLEAVWMNLLYYPQSMLEQVFENHEVSLEEALELTEFMSHIIDFRSPFTAMHSAGVAQTAECLAKAFGMSAEECRMMRLAGHLHDIGKLKIPKEILEKPGKLTDSEFNVMKEHVYYTYVILKDISGFEQITDWAALHHEKLNGKGYPFHLEPERIPLGSRIMAVADIFSAITEERPYRKGMGREQVFDVLRGDVEKGALSGSIVELLLDNYEEIDGKRAEASRKASSRYQEMLKKNEKEA